MLVALSDMVRLPLVLVAASALLGCQLDWSIPSEAGPGAITAHEGGAGGSSSATGGEGGASSASTSSTSSGNAQGSGGGAAACDATPATCNTCTTCSSSGVCVNETVACTNEPGCLDVETCIDSCTLAFPDCIDTCAVGATAEAVHAWKKWSYCIDCQCLNTCPGYCADWNGIAID